jgi:hypothetical protein
MKATFFVCASAGLFASWLAITYFRRVPSELYPTLGRGSVPISAANDAPEDPAEPLLSMEVKKDKPVAEVAK